MSSSFNISDIYRALWYQYRQYSYHVENTYLFDWESDFLCMSKAGYVYEFEIKMSYSDFKADFKKTDKHTILESEKPFIQKGYTQRSGYIESVTRKYKKHTHGQQVRTDLLYSGEYKGRYSKVNVHKEIRTDIFPKFPNKIRPHKFLYVCPEDMIPLEEVPEYAGLMYFKPHRRRRGGRVNYIKQPPFLHKDELPNLEKRLNEKIYWSYRNAKEREYGLR